MQPPETLLALAKKAMQNAYAPYSHFHVGASIQTTSSQMYAGCNVENAAYGLTLCAEANALCNMVLAGEQHVEAILILTAAPSPCPPCGACRQRIAEFAQNNTILYLCTTKGDYEAHRFEAIFPNPFAAPFLENT